MSSLSVEKTDRSESSHTEQSSDIYEYLGGWVREAEGVLIDLEVETDIRQNKHQRMERKVGESRAKLRAAKKEIKDVERLLEDLEDMMIEQGRLDREIAAGAHQITHVYRKSEDSRAMSDSDTETGVQRLDGLIADLGGKVLDHEHTERTREPFSGQSRFRDLKDELQLCCVVFHESEREVQRLKAVIEDLNQRFNEQELRTTKLLAENMALMRRLKMEEVMRRHRRAKQLDAVAGSLAQLTLDELAIDDEERSKPLAELTDAEFQALVEGSDDHGLALARELCLRGESVHALDRLRRDRLGRLGTMRAVTNGAAHAPAGDRAVALVVVNGGVSDEDDD